MGWDDLHWSLINAEQTVLRIAQAHRLQQTPQRELAEEQDAKTAEGSTVIQIRKRHFPQTYGDGQFLQPETRIHFETGREGVLLFRLPQ